VPSEPLRRDGVGGRANPKSKSVDKKPIFIEFPRREYIIGDVDTSVVRNVGSVLASFTEHWSPRTIAVVNGYDVRVVKIRGEYSRHSHPETDEFFMVLSGQLTIRMDNGDTVLNPGDTYVVPRGRRHQPFAENETEVLLFEPTGDGSARLIPEHPPA
jgi:mannose-6-phosphate isomerase-like protein (cupin superfamily)